MLCNIMLCMSWCCGKLWNQWLLAPSQSMNKVVKIICSLLSPWSNTCIIHVWIPYKSYHKKVLRGFWWYPPGTIKAFPSDPLWVSRDSQRIPNGFHGSPSKGFSFDLSKDSHGIPWDSQGNLNELSSPPKWSMGFQRNPHMIPQWVGFSGDPIRVSRDSKYIPLDVKGSYWILKLFSKDAQRDAMRFPSKRFSQDSSRIFRRSNGILKGFFKGSNDFQRNP